MMRSLWTGASGMIAQQTNIDTISNNLANVNTYGYKKERLEFKSLLYQTMQRATLDPANQTGRPVNLQVGHGVRPSATTRLFSVGSFEATGNTMDFALQGDGFFTVRTDMEGGRVYTRDGAIKLSVVEEGLMFTTSDGYAILGIDDEPIIIPDGVDMATVSISEEGIFQYVNDEGETEDMDMQFSLVQFSNPQGLETIGGNFYIQTTASGVPLSEANGEVNNRTQIVQGYVEMSNVQVAEEMVKMIVAQRAYELNSKSITTSDEMLQTANGLKR